MLEKHRYILDLCLASMKKRKGKNISLIVVYSFILFLLASVLFTTEALKKEAELLLQESPPMIVQKMLAGRQDLIPTSYIDSIKTIRGIQSVRPRLWGYYYDSFTGANYTVMVNESLNSTPGGIVVGSGVARRGNIEGAGSDLGVDDIIPFKAADGSALPLRIRGFLPFRSELITADLVLMAESDLRKLFAIPEGKATDLVLEVRNPLELPTIAEKITRMHSDTRPIERNQILRTYNAIFDWRGGIVVVVLTGAILAFAILAWDKATGLSAEEKREIGILKAVGWDISDILLMKFWEGAAVSLFSFSIGVSLAYLHVFVGSMLLFQPVLKGWSVLYPDFRLTPYLDGYMLATLFFLTVVPYTVVTIVPSWRSATIDPDSVMRS